MQRQQTKSERNPNDGAPLSLSTFPNNLVYQFDTGLPKILTDEIINYFSQNDLKRGTAQGKEHNNDYRDTDVYWCKPHDWVGPFMYNYINQCNEHLFQYDISGVYYNECHMLSYGPGQFYNWHVDAAAGDHMAYAPPANKTVLVNYPLKEWTRKLSFTLQLSDEHEYTGGEVEISGEDDPKTPNPVAINKKRGTIVIFDSKIRHRVLPVKTGNRKVLVGWAVGPKWK